MLFALALVLLLLGKLRCSFRLRFTQNVFFSPSPGLRRPGPRFQFLFLLLASGLEEGVQQVRSLALKSLVASP